MSGGRAVVITAEAMDGVEEKESQVGVLGGCVGVDDAQHVRDNAAQNFQRRKGEVGGASSGDCAKAFIVVGLIGHRAVWVGIVSVTFLRASDHMFPF
jgi:hypothetical protein